MHISTHAICRNTEETSSTEFVFDSPSIVIALICTLKFTAVVNVYMYSVFNVPNTYGDRFKLLKQNDTTSDPTPTTNSSCWVFLCALNMLSFY